MSDASAQYSFRLPVELVERIERRVEREKRLHPGRTLNRADVVRELLHEALEVYEQQAAKSSKRRKRA